MSAPDPPRPAAFLDRDGVLIVVAKDDRRMRIEVAKALEGAIPDIAAARIIDGAMKPRFREGNFAGGLLAAVDQIDARIAGESLPASQGPGQGSGGHLQFLLFQCFYFLNCLSRYLLLLLLLLLILYLYSYLSY